MTVPRSGMQPAEPVEVYLVLGPPLRTRVGEVEPLRICGDGGYVAGRDQAEKSWFEPPRPRLRMSDQCPCSAHAPDADHMADGMVRRSVTGDGVAVHGDLLRGKETGLTGPDPGMLRPPVTRRNSSYQRLDGPAKGCAAGKAVRERPSHA
jgi:hypothetical protein